MISKATLHLFWNKQKTRQSLVQDGHFAYYNHYIWNKKYPDLIIDFSSFVEKFSYEIYENIFNV